MLEALIDTYLHEQGFHSSMYPDGMTYWGHPELGEGRTFLDVVAWQIGREASAAGKAGVPDGRGGFAIGPVLTHA